MLGEAEALLDAVGYNGFSVEAVAAAAGIHKSSIYSRWPSRTDLLTQVLVDRLHPVAETDGEEPAALLVRIAQHELALADSPAGRAAVQVIFTDNAAAAARRLRDAQRRRHDAYVALLTHAAAVTHARFHAPTTVDVLLAACWGAALWELPSVSHTAKVLVATLTRN